MKRAKYSPIFLAATTAFLLHNPLRAQQPVSGAQPPFRTRPTISPYLNLLRSDNTVLNYHGIVRPEMQLRANESQLRSNLGELRSQFDRYRTGTKAANSNLNESGHRVQFLSDLRGRNWSLNQDQQTRNLQWKLAPYGNIERIPATGHLAYFGNRSSYYGGLRRGQ